MKDKLGRIILIVVIGFACSVIFHYMLAYYFNLNYYPFNTFLFDQIDAFADFTNLHKASANLNPYYDYSFSNTFPWLLFCCICLVCWG